MYLEALAEHEHNLSQQVEHTIASPYARFYKWSTFNSLSNTCCSIYAVTRMNDTLTLQLPTVDGNSLIHRS